MSALGGRAEEYLRIRRMLGHELAEAARLLPRFVAYLDDTGAEVITVEAALAWAQQPPAGQQGGGPADDRGPRVRPPHGWHRSAHAGAAARAAALPPALAAAVHLLRRRHPGANGWLAPRRPLAAAGGHLPDADRAACRHGDAGRGGASPGTRPGRLG